MFTRIKTATWATTTTLGRALPVLLWAFAAHAAEFAVVDQHGTPLRFAVVTASSAADADGIASVQEASVAQVRQQFLPRVTVVPTGTMMEFPNRDTTQHHVYSFSDAKQFEIELYKGESPDPVPFERAGIVALGCNIHDWMLGYVYVTDDRHFSTSDASGRLDLDIEREDIASLTVWHPAALEVEPQTMLAVPQGDHDEPIRLVVATRAEDPLEFEIDALQRLFSGTDE